jgi:hypothetical protein
MTDGESQAELQGELSPPPRGPLATAAMALSGFALVRAGLRLGGRFALAYRQPAALRLSIRGLEISHRTELLGRVLSDGETLIPLSNLSSITREVRFARLGLYAGLLALVVGTYVGMGLLVDGVRVPGGSPSLLGMGLVAIGAGIALDYGLSVALGAVSQKCRVVVVPVHGRPLCLAGLDPTAADLVLARVATSLSGGTPAEPAPAVATETPRVSTSG